MNEKNEMRKINTHFISSSGSRIIINYGSGSDFLTSYDSGSAIQKATVPVPQLCKKFNSGSGSEAVLMMQLLAGAE